MALSRNDPFSMPVIQCLGSFLGMTASSRSVSTLMARSSSVTRTQAASFAGWAEAEPTLANASRQPKANLVTDALEWIMRLP